MDSEVQAVQIAALLKEKGYPDVAEFNWGSHWRVAQGLIFQRKSESERRYSKYGACMRFIADIYYHQYNDHISTAFNVDYNDTTGFAIVCMEILGDRPAGRKTYPKELFPETWDSVPSVNQVKDMVGVNMKNQLRQLSDFFKGRGYDTNFSIAEGQPVPLEAGLENYLVMQKINMGDGKRFSLPIRTHSHFRSAEDRIDCTFGLEYSDYCGFRVDGMVIHRYRSQKKDPIEQSLDLIHWHKVPTAEQVNRRMRLGVAQKRKGL